MKRVMFIFWIVIAVSNVSLGLSFIDISDPGEIVAPYGVIGNSIAPHIRVDYYTESEPGTHYKLFRRATTYGHLRMYHYSRLTVAGGTLGSDLWFLDNSSGVITSGSGPSIRTKDNSHLTITGGSVSTYIEVADNSHLDISGGEISGLMQIAGNGIATLSGSDFKVGGHAQPMGALNIAQLFADGLLVYIDNTTQASYPHYQYRGDLSGVLFDGNSFDIELVISHFIDSGGDTANLILTPEPGTFFLLAPGVVWLCRKKGRSL